MTQEYIDTTLSSMYPGDCFRYGGIDWITIDRGDEHIKALSADIAGNSRFDDEINNFQFADIEGALDAIVELMCEAGADSQQFVNISHDLTSDDGSLEYGRCVAEIGLLSCGQYREARQYIPDASDWWWTCTPVTTRKDSHLRRAVCTITHKGLVSMNQCNTVQGIRPVVGLRKDTHVLFKRKIQPEPVHIELPTDKDVARAVRKIARMAYTAAMCMEQSK